MQFSISGKLPQNYTDYDVDSDNGRLNKYVNAIAERLTDDEYHELCHQLHGTKSEFDGDDDGEVHMDYVDKKYYAVKSALYRGIFWATMSQLDELDESKLFIKF